MILGTRSLALEINKIPELEVLGNPKVKIKIK